jgi:enoyl-CoA hydratase
MGAGNAADFLLRNRRLASAQALAAGLVNEVAADPLVRAVELAVELARGPVGALSDTKLLLLDASRRSLADQLAAEAAAVSRALHADEFPEGVAAFLEKREPEFP